MQVSGISFTGTKHDEIVAAMKANTGIPSNQSNLSSLIPKVRCFMKRENILPDLSPRPSQKIAVDPSHPIEGCFPKQPSRQVCV